MTKRIGTILHGALGDCYEQLCAIKIMRSSKPGTRWIGFFAVKDRMTAMSHYSMDMFEEVYLADEIGNIKIDEFYQFQIRDIELNKGVLDHLPDEERRKFDFNRNILPWHTLKSFDYAKGSMKLELSDLGKKYMTECCKLNQVSDELFLSKFTVGFLWRYRSKGGAVNPLFQRSKEWILRSKGELFNELINKYNAHIIIAGMNKKQEQSDDLFQARGKAGVVVGEHNSKFANETLDIPSPGCTYLKGLGYAAEMEIMARCDVLLLMPSGFSEPLWLRASNKVLIIDPPPVYMAKIILHRMPFFNCNRFSYLIFSLIPHTSKNVINFLKLKSLIKHS